jgi:Protein kinase domain/Cyclic nucleotide-binding domain
MNELASHLVDKEFEAGTTIFKEGQTVEGALYIVRDGSLKISSSDGTRSEIITTGGYFGQEQLLADIKRQRVEAKYSVFVGDEQCVCGILTLKDCRSVFDTTAMEDGSYTGGSSYKLSKRQTVKDSIKKDFSLDTMKKEYLLGEGQFAEVWLVSADLPVGHQEFALKIQHCDDEIRHDNALESIRREITVLEQLHHPFIIDLVATFDKMDGSIYMLMEAVKGGELWSVIHQEGDDGEWKSGLIESHAKFYSLLMADTLAYMHKEKFIFRDLKPENVLIDEDGYPIIVDFGFAKYCPDKTYTFCGTPNYLAPEIVTNRGHGAGADHWALGVVTYEMITGENPFYFEDMNQMALFQAIVQEPMFPPGDDASPEMMDFLSGLLEKDPIQRLGMLAGRERDVLRHKWFADLDFDKMRNKEAKAPWLPKTSR